MKPVDAHCHLNFKQYDEDRKEIIEEARDKLEFIGVPGVNLESNREVLELQEDYLDFVVPSLGLHPTYTDSFDEVDEIMEQIREEDPAAVGEIGLDYHHVTDDDMRQLQEKVFRKLLSLAEELEKPVVVHSREAEEKAIEIIREDDPPEAFMHCFNGTPELAEKAVDQGMKLGVTTQVLYSTQVQDIVEKIDPEHLILETDSPFLYRGGRNRPVNVLESAEKISEVKNVSENDVIKKTTANANSIHQVS